jgi:hypothetical protein
MEKKLGSSRSRVRVWTPALPVRWMKIKIKRKKKKNNVSQPHSNNIRQLYSRWYSKSKNKARGYVLTPILDLST